MSKDTNKVVPRIAGWTEEQWRKAREQRDKSRKRNKIPTPDIIYEKGHSN